MTNSSKKDFNIWNETKKKLHFNKKRPGFHEREIWFCSLGKNIGYEQDGRNKDFLRPLVVIRKFNNEIFLGVPLTRTEKRGKHYFAFSFVNNEISVAILSQMKLVDAKRLQYKTGYINTSGFKKLKKRLKALLE